MFQILSNLFFKANPFLKIVSALLIIFLALFAIDFLTNLVNKANTVYNILGVLGIVSIIYFIFCLTLNIIKKY